MSQLTVGARGKAAPRALTRTLGRRGATGVARPASTSGVRVLDVSASRVSGPGFALLMIALLFAGLMASLVLNTLRSEDSFRVAELQRQHILLTETEAGLRASVAEAQSADSLTARASGLGMVASPSTAFIHLSDGSVVGVAAPGEGSAADTVARITEVALVPGASTD